MAETTLQGVPNIVLTGFSYTGKTTYGRLLARRLAWRFVDTDDQVEARAGVAIPKIFAEFEGEERFRRLERAALAEACGGHGAVVATGGGAVLDAENRQVMSARAAVICLESQPSTIERRLREVARDPGAPTRPLLAQPDPFRHIRDLKASRQPFYAIADWTVHTDDLSPEEVVEETLRGAGYAARRLRERRALTDAGDSSSAESDSPDTAHHDVTCVVRTATASYPVYIGAGSLASLGNRMREQSLTGKAILVVDGDVAPLYGEAAERSLTQAGFDVVAFTVSPGEASKSLEWASRIYDWMVEQRVERDDPVVALGGGVVGDLAGYVAATYLRGLPLVQVPTTLLAMADAAIGGKVAVDHPRGKNLIGAFHQPALVLADIETLRTLPPRILHEGFAEVVKTALILDAQLFAFLDQHAEALLALEKTPLLHALSRCAALKGWVVSRDERETGLRAILNYGHSLGHALEAATGYQGLLHGEAVAVGMAAAGEISHRQGLLSAESLTRQNALLGRFGLPFTLPPIDMGAVLDAMELDKKTREGSLRWVLLEEIGRGVMDQAVEPETVRAVLEGLGGIG